MSVWVSMASGVVLSVVFPKAFSEFVDKAVIVYTLFAIFCIGAFVRFARQNRANEAAKKAYKYVKKELSALTWKQKFVGTWEKTARNGFIEFLVWTGELKPAAAWGLGSTLNNKAMTAYIKLSGDEKQIMLYSEGFPATSGQWMTLGADMIPFTGEADSGKESAYWVEEKQQLVRLRETVKTQLLLTQTRIMKDDNTMELIIHGKKLDPNAPVPTCECSMTFKRVEA